MSRFYVAIAILVMIIIIVITMKNKVSLQTPTNVVSSTPTTSVVSTTTSVPTSVVSSTPTTNVPTGVVSSAPTDGYTFYDMLDSYGNDYTQLSGDISTLKAACSANPRCVGFNSNGWMKYSLRPLADWSIAFSSSGLGLYKKN